MDYIFSAIGGSGSTYLIKALSASYSVGNKPDTVFRPSYDDLRVGNTNTQQGTFDQRSGGFSLKINETLEEVLPRYIKYLKSDPGRTAVFNTCAELGYFNKFKVENVVFLVRHVLHAYVSWAKPERHGIVISHLGGIHKKDAIEFYVRRWNRFVSELLRLRDAGILGGQIRFELAQEDANILGLNWIFEDFDATKRNYGVLLESEEQYIRDLSKNYYYQIYEHWKI